MKKKLTIFLCLCSLIINAQLQNRHWYFGAGAALDFGSSLSGPSSINPLSGDQISFEGSSVISDANGNFLFYSNGEIAINNLGQTFANNLGGNASSTQSCIIIAEPGSCENYYIFIVGAREFPTTSGVRYHKISTSSWTILQSGTLDCDDCVEKITAIPHTNGEDYWILSAKPSSKEIPVYAVSSTGIVRTVASQLPLPFTGLNNFPNSTLSGGSIKANRTGNLFAVSFSGGSISTNFGLVHLFSFDPQIGQVSSYLNTFNQPFAYGIEFSSSSDYIYVSSNGDGITPSSASLVQYSTNSSFNQINSFVASSNEVFGGLQIGPDDKIYLSHFSDNYLSSINTPNSSTWGFQLGSVTSNGFSLTRYGLPNIVPAPINCSEFDPCDPDETAPVIACQANPVTLILDQNRVATLTLGMLNVSVTDNCGRIRFSFSHESFTCKDLGESSVVLTATDEAGNDSSCTINVMITDPNEFCCCCDELKKELAEIKKLLKKHMKEKH